MSDGKLETPQLPPPDPAPSDPNRTAISPFDATLPQSPAAHAQTVEVVTPPASSGDAPTLDGAFLRSTPEDAPQLRLVDPSSYTISGEIDQGGIGRIYRARDERLNRPVALKELLDPAGGADERFVREALVTARLQHPGIVPVYEAGRWPSGDPFYAMKLVSGRSFDKVIDETRTLDQRLALLPHVLAVTEAMAYAHGEHIIHRDLKPANILVGAFGETVVVDWGLAKDLRSEDAGGPASAAAPSVAAEGGSPGAANITMAGAILGTPVYMPPEQAAGRQVDARADVYSLGALLYHLLAGAPPYDGRSAYDVLRKVLAGPPPPLSSRQKGVPPDLVTLVDKAMARDPASRYPTANELSEDLKRFQTGQIVGAHHYSRREKLARFARRYRAPLAVAAFALAALAALGAVSVLRIVEERRIAQQERDLAARRQVDAEQAQRQAADRADALTLVEASSAATRDPNEAIAWLKSLSPTFKRWGEARLIAADADSHWIATVLRGHKGIVNQVTWSPDSRSLATCSDDRTVRVWGVNGELIRLLDRHEDELWTCQYSPDGRRLASGSKDGTIRLWDLGTGVAEVLRGHTGGILALRFSPDGRHLVSKGQEDSAWLWSLDTREGRALPGGPSSSWTAIFSPDGKEVAFAADKRLFVYSLAGAASRSFPIPATGVQSIAFSPDASSIAFGGPDGAVWLIDARTGVSRRLYSHAGPVTEVTFFPGGGAIASAGKDGVVGVLDLRAGTHSMLRGHDNHVYGIAISPDGAQIASAGNDHTVRLWDPATGRARILGGFRDIVVHLSYSRDGTRLAATSYDQTARIWDLAHPPDRILARHQKSANRAIFSPDGRLVASGGDDGAILLTPLSSGETVVLGRHDGPVHALGFATDGGHVISGGDDGKILVSAVADRRGVEREGHDGPIREIALSPDGSHFASGGKDGTVRLWEIAGGDARLLVRHEGSVDSLAFSPDGKRLASGGADGEVRVVDLAGGEPRSLGKQQGPVGALAYSPDGRFLVSGSRDHTLRIWDASSLGLLHSIDAGGVGITRIVFAPDSASFATAGTEAPIKVWETASGRSLAILRGHKLRAAGLSSSPDGTRIASSDARGVVRVWDLRSGAGRELAGHSAPVPWVTFSPDGKWIVSAGDDGTVRLSKDDLPQDPAGLRSWLESATPDSLAEAAPSNPLMVGPGSW